MRDRSSLDDGTPAVTPRYREARRGSGFCRLGHGARCRRRGSIAEVAAIAAEVPAEPVPALRRTDGASAVPELPESAIGTVEPAAAPPSRHAPKSRPPLYWRQTGDASQAPAPHWKHPRADRGRCVGTASMKLRSGSYASGTHACGCHACRNPGRRSPERGQAPAPTRRARYNDRGKCAGVSASRLEGAGIPAQVRQSVLTEHAGFELQLGPRTAPARRAGSPRPVREDPGGRPPKFTSTSA